MIPLFKVRMNARIAADTLYSTLASGFIGEGPRVVEFEKALSKVLGRPLLATGSCTDALQCVLTVLDVGPGDEVITTPMTCVATNAPIVQCGARPMWADVFSTNGNIDPLDVERKLTHRTKAIIAVNWTGRPAKYDELKKFGVPVIEDAAHGPIIGPRPTGDYICYSFGPIKHFTTGDGGAVWTQTETQQMALRLARWYGLDRTSSKDFRCEQNITIPGSKFHMNDINATIGLANLPDLLTTVSLHQSNARYIYDRLIHELPSLMSEDSDLPIWMPTFSPESNYWVFPILCQPEEKERIKQYLLANDVMASEVHARNDKHTAYNYPNGPLKGVGAFVARQLNIPCGWWLQRRDLDYICDVVLGAANG